MRLLDRCEFKIAEKMTISLLLNSRHLTSGVDIEDHDMERKALQIVNSHKALQSMAESLMVNSFLRIAKRCFT